MADTEYQGWTNYETWAVYTWWSNDEGHHRAWADRAGEVLGDSHSDRLFTARERARIELADAMRDDVCEGQPELDGPYCDLLDAAISDVDWFDLADAYLDSATGEDR